MDSINIEPVLSLEELFGELFNEIVRANFILQMKAFWQTVLSTCHQHRSHQEDSIYLSQLAVW